MNRLLVLLLFLMMFSLQSYSQSAVETHDLIGNITVKGRPNEYSESDRNKNKEDLFSSSQSYRSLSRTGTGLSIFATGLIHVTGMNPAYLIDMVTGTQSQRAEQHFQLNREQDAGDFVMFLGTFSATLASYKFGNKNDIIAFLPLCPVRINSLDNQAVGFRESQRYLFQFGFFFYYSRKF